VKKLTSGTLITVSSEDIALSKDYTNKVMSSTVEEYTRRANGNITPESIWWDTFISKKSEFAMYRYLTSMDFKCSAPDVNIYDIKNKSFSSDLTISIFDTRKIKVHVKCVEKDKIKYYRHQPSYTFEYKDTVTIRPSLEDYIGCMIQERHNVFRYLDMLSALKVFPNFLDKPEKPSLRKHAIYYNDIIAGWY